MLWVSSFFSFPGTYIRIGVPTNTWNTMQGSLAKPSAFLFLFLFILLFKRFVELIFLFRLRTRGDIRQVSTVWCGSAATAKAVCQESPLAVPQLPPLTVFLLKPPHLILVSSVTSPLSQPSKSQTSTLFSPLFPISSRSLNPAFSTTWISFKPVLV